MSSLFFCVSHLPLSPWPLPHHAHGWAGAIPLNLNPMSGARLLWRHFLISCLFPWIIQHFLASPLFTCCIPCFNFQLSSLWEPPCWLLAWSLDIWVLIICSPGSIFLLPRGFSNLRTEWMNLPLLYCFFFVHTHWELFENGAKFC